MRSTTPILTAFLVAAAAAQVRGAALQYDVEIDPDERRTIDVELRLTGYPGDAVSFVLATPALDAETYFRFFDDVRCWGADSLARPLDRVGPGIYRVSGVREEVTLRYRVHVGDLNAVAGDGHRLPLVDEDGAVLPLRSILAVPESDDIEPEVPVNTVTITVTDGKRPLHVPWRTRAGRASFTGREARDIARSAIVVTGDAEVVDETDGEASTYVVLRGGGAPQAARAASIVRRLVERHVASLGLSGHGPVAVVVELEEGPSDVAGFGRFVRARCPAAYLEATPAELTYGTDAYGFYRSLAHETYHRWIGTLGFARPESPEVFWLSEGAAEYSAWIALVRAELVPPETVLDAIADLTRRVRAHPDRGTRIDGDAETYASSASYRQLMLLRSPLVCFLLDTRLLERENPATQRTETLDALMRRVLFAGIRREVNRNPVFRATDIEEALTALLGEAAPAVLTTYLTGTLDAALAARATAAGIDWVETDDGPVLSFEPAGAFARRLGVWEGQDAGATTEADGHDGGAGTR